jgi:hypothetical protein
MRRGGVSLFFIVFGRLPSRLGTTHSKIAGGFKALRRRQHDVLPPGVGHDLNADGQSIGRRTCARHYSRPDGQTVRHGAEAELFSS